ncbi:MAG: hypothetical protein IJ287_08745 [Methanobrevibacter sp.]|nr:hypothetical protein [Methanobrevibacter sp.]
MVVLDNIDDEFFVIDSNNLDSVENRLYGFLVQNDHVIQNDNINHDADISDMGAYVYVKASEDEITITNDFIGSYGLYLYKSDGYFAISNSFYKLFNHLKYDHKLTANDNYVDSFLTHRALCTLAYCETAVNEIESLPRNIIVHINRKNSSIDIEEIDHEENSISIDTSEGFEIIDRWYYKWVAVIRSIIENSNNMRLDLSGGFDTRIVAALVFSANVDLNTINVYSIDNKVTMLEDIEIARQIADSFGFELNIYNDNMITEPIENMEGILDASFYTKFAINNQYNFKYVYPVDPLYAFSGSGGGCIRGHPNMNTTDYCDYWIKRAKKSDSSLIKPTREILDDGFSKVRELYSENEDELPWRHYKETRLRYHFGKLAVENYLSNVIRMSPLIDSDLYKLKINTLECDDDLLLMTIILSRYCPKLLDFKVQGKRKFNEDTIRYAQELNEKFPFKPKELKQISGRSHLKREKSDVKSDKQITPGELTRYLRNIFITNAFEHEFKKYFPSKIYERIYKSVFNHKSFPLQDACAAFSIVKIYEDLGLYMKKSDTPYNWLNDFTDDKYFSKNTNHELISELNKFATARIDVLLENPLENDFEILEMSDDSTDIMILNHIKDSKAISLVNQNGSLDFKLKCKGTGKLTFKLKGLFRKDKNKITMPIYIDYTRFNINDEEILSENTLVWHNKPFIYDMDIKEGETISVSSKWMPLSIESDYSKFSKR